MRISPTHSRPNAPLITSYLLALTSLRSADHLPLALRPCLLARSLRHLLLLGRRQHRRTRCMRLGKAYCRSNAPGNAPAHLSLAEKPSSYPQPIPTPRRPPPDTSPIPHLPSTNLPYAQESAGRAGGGKVGWWACGGRAWGRRTGRSGPLTALEGHGQPRVRIFFDSALPAHAVGCSVRASCSTNFLLHEGMLVVCVRVRHFFTSPPPIAASGGA